MPNSWIMGKSYILIHDVKKIYSGLITHQWRKRMNRDYKIYLAIKRLQLFIDYVFRFQKNVYNMNHKWIVFTDTYTYTLYAIQATHYLFVCKNHFTQYLILKIMNYILHTLYLFLVVYLIGLNQLCTYLLYIVA